MWALNWQGTLLVACFKKKCFTGLLKGLTRACIHVTYMCECECTGVVSSRETSGKVKRREKKFMGEGGTWVGLGWLGQDKLCRQPDIAAAWVGEPLMNRRTTATPNSHRLQ